MNQDTPVSKFDVSSLLLLLLLILGVALAFGMVRPYLDAIIMAGILAIIMNSLHQRILTLLGDRDSLAAFLTSMLLTIVVVIPSFLVARGISFSIVGGETKTPGDQRLGREIDH